LTSQPATTTPEPTRRQVLCGLAVALLAPGAFAAACGGGSSGSSGSGGAITTGAATTGAATTGGGATTTAGTGGGSNTALARLSDVPVGGGILVDGPSGKVLLVQRTAGTVKAYDPTCTHMQFTVSPPQGDTIRCDNPGPNHGSQFSVSDGSVTRGPATRPLATIAVRVSSDSIVLA
jgi:cytochrome b6-f complex iron-sulfur subunit